MCAMSVFQVKYLPPLVHIDRHHCETLMLNRPQCDCWAATEPEAKLVWEHFHGTMYHKTVPTLVEAKRPQTQWNHSFQDPLLCSGNCIFYGIVWWYYIKLSWSLNPNPKTHKQEINAWACLPWKVDDEVDDYFEGFVCGWAQPPLVWSIISWSLPKVNVPMFLHDVHSSTFSNGSLSCSMESPLSYLSQRVSSSLPKNIGHFNIVSSRVLSQRSHWLCKHHQLFLWVMDTRCSAQTMPVSPSPQTHQS